MSNSKRILAALLAGAMVLCAGCGKEEETEEESSNSTAVEVTDVTSGAMSSEYTLNGKIAAVNEVQVFPLLATVISVGVLVNIMAATGVRGLIAITFVTLPVVLIYVFAPFVLPLAQGSLGYLDDELAAAILQRHKDRDRPCD